MVLGCCWVPCFLVSSLLHASFSLDPSERSPGIDYPGFISTFNWFGARVHDSLHEFLLVGLGLVTFPGAPILEGVFTIGVPASSKFITSLVHSESSSTSVEGGREFFHELRLVGGVIWPPSAVTILPFIAGSLRNCRIIICALSLSIFVVVMTRSWS